MPPADLHRELVRGALQARGARDPDQHLRSELLQVARHGEEHRRRGLEERLRQVLQALAVVRHHPREERQGDRDVAPEDVAERQVRHGAMVALGEGRVVEHHVRGGGEMRTVRHQRALRVARRARRVDDERAGGRVDRRAETLQVVHARRAAGLHQLREGPELGMVVGEHRRVVDDDDPAQRGERVRVRQDLVDVLLVLRDEDRGGPVLHLVLDLGGRGRRVDAVGDRPQRLRAEVAEDPLLAGVAHDRDALAMAEAERGETGRAAGDELRVPAPRALAIQPEVLRAVRDDVRLAPRALGKQRRRAPAAQLGVPLGGITHGRASPGRKEIDCWAPAWMPPPAPRLVPDSLSIAL